MMNRIWTAVLGTTAVLAASASLAAAQEDVDTTMSEVTETRPLTLDTLPHPGAEASHRVGRRAQRACRTG